MRGFKKLGVFFQDGQAEVCEVGGTPRWTRTRGRGNYSGARRGRADGGAGGCTGPFIATPVGGSLQRAGECPGPPQSTGHPSLLLGTRGNAGALQVQIGGSARASEKHRNGGHPMKRGTG